MKEYRIRQAAVLLRQTQATIVEIANQAGYENQSKFATVFRDIKMISSAECRKQNVGEWKDDEKRYCQMKPTTAQRQIFGKSMEIRNVGRKCYHTFFEEI